MHHSSWQNKPRFSFEANGIPHEFVVSGKHAMNAARMQQDIEKMCHQKFPCLVRRRLQTIPL